MELGQQLNAALVDSEMVQRQLELDKRGLTVLLTQVSAMLLLATERDGRVPCACMFLVFTDERALQETEMRHKLEQQLTTKEEQWSGCGLDKLGDVALSALLHDVDNAASRIRAEQETRRRHARQTLMALERDLMCPIGQDFYKDPVVAADGAC
eukprot:COSAG01_NODE_2069_length_8498_cov_5.965841_5_plen_154_part_00